MAYCQNCGAAVDGRYCAKCGAAVGSAAAGQDTGAVPPRPAGPPAASEDMTDNIAGAIAYIPILGIVFLLIQPYNRNKLIRFHAFQGLFLLATSIVVSIFMNAVTTVMGSMEYIRHFINLVFV